MRRTAPHTPRIRQPVTPPGATRPGAILLEIVLALALFVAVAITLLSVVSGSIDSLNRSRDRLTAADHARNAMAMIEAGIARPETLIGQVQPWTGSEESLAGFDDGLGPNAGALEMDAMASPSAGTFAEDTRWALEIETEPAEVRGLTLVTVRAFRSDTDGFESESGSSFTLRQIMVLSGEAGEDEFGGFGGGP